MKLLLFRFKSFCLGAELDTGTVIKVWQAINIKLLRSTLQKPRLNKIQLFLFIRQTNAYKVSSKNFVKLALLLFELSCMKVKGIKFFACS